MMCAGMGTLLKSRPVLSAPWTGYRPHCSSSLAGTETFVLLSVVKTFEMGTLSKLAVTLPHTVVPLYLAEAS